MKTKKHIKFILLYLLLFAISYSCKKSSWYEEKSDKSITVPTTLGDMQALMDNGKAMNTFTPGLGEVASDGHYILDQSMLQLIPGERNAYTWSDESTFPSGLDWNQQENGSYVRIYYANLVLDGIGKIKPRDSKEQIQWNNIKGQALFHRAHAFYELAQVYSPCFDAANAVEQLGIPLRLQSDVNISVKRGTNKETYDQIINDLFMARDLLPESPIYKTRPSKQAVLALLARCHLSMENYSQAGDYADECLNIYGTLINYSTLNLISAENPFINYNAEIIFYSSLGGYTSIHPSTVLIDRSLFDSYDINDLRKVAFFNFDEINNLVNYKGTYSGMGYNLGFSGLATDEMYLIRAECSARAGKATEAMQDLNDLLRTRWSGTYTDQTATDADDALRKVLAERKKELVLRGLRWSDLRRLNRDPRFAITMTRVVDGNTYTIEPNSYKYTMPIPEDVLLKTGIEQNEGWDK